MLSTNLHPPATHTHRRRPKRARIGACCLIAALSVAAGISPASALGGDLWTGFSGDGLASTGTDVAGPGTAVAVDTGTGRVYEAAYATSGEFGGQIFVAAFDADGALDPGFSGDGLAGTGISGFSEAGVGLTVDSGSGRIYVASYGFNDEAPGEMWVAALNYDGTPDTGFSSDGMAHTGIQDRFDSGAAATIDPVTGRILVASQALFSTGNGELTGQAYLAAFRTDGTLDSTFSADGLAGTQITGDSSAGLGLAADPATGRVYFSGWSSTGNPESGGFVAAFSSDGSLDPSFSGDGVVVDPGSPREATAGYSVAVDHSNGRVYLGSPLGKVTAYRPDGTLVTGFGTGGHATTPFANADTGLRTGVAVDTHSGAVYLSTRVNNQAAVAAWDAQGRLHRGFGTIDGVATTGIVGGGGNTFALATDPGSGTVYLATTAGSGNFSGQAYVAAFERANPVPHASPDDAEVSAPGAVTIDVLANDTDPEQDPLSITEINATGTAGSVTVNPDDTISYDSSGVSVGPGQSIADTFKYTITDGQSFSTAIVTVTVRGPNTAPVATDDNAAVTFPATTTIDVLGNDTDADGDPLSVTGIDTTGTAGAVSLAKDGTFSYDSSGVSLAPGTSVEDTFGYAVSDGQAEATATVTITITREKATTSLAVNPALFDSATGTYFGRFSSTLTDSEGQAVVGRTVSYTVGGKVYCTGTTDSVGYSACSSGWGLFAVLFAHSYTATFTGDTTYLPGTGSAPAIR